MTHERPTKLNWRNLERYHIFSRSTKIVGKLKCQQQAAIKLIDCTKQAQNESFEFLRFAGLWKIYGNSRKMREICRELKRKPSPPKLFFHCFCFKGLRKGGEVVFGWLLQLMVVFSASALQVWRRL
jgi:hypothetical protein